MIYWEIAAGNAKATRRTESWAARASYIIPTLAAVALLFPHLWSGWLAERFLPPSLAGYWIGIAVLAAGLAFSVWARIHLGRNWSARVTLKEDHQLIQSGPYRLIRHPIYTGMLGGFVGTAIAIGRWNGPLAVALITVALIRKLSIEERFMAEAFPDEYPGYCAKSWALVPFIF